MAIIETWDDNENEYSFFRCDHCGVEHDLDVKTFDEDFCSGHCWFRSDIKNLKKWIIHLINQGCLDADRIFNLMESYGFYYKEEISESSINRFKRAIQNRINKKAAQSAVTLKAA